MLTRLIAILEQGAMVVPLPLFIFGGTVLEELIAPLPSPIVTTLTGSLAAAQGKSVGMLLLLCAIGTLGKTMGAWLFYILGDKLEDIVVPRFGWFLGVRHADLEHIGAHFRGNWKDEVILIVLRSIPVMPSTPVSLLCGIVKLPLRSFLTSTYIGFFFRNLFFLSLGYTGLAASGSLIEGIDSIESALKAFVVVLVLVFLCWLYWRRTRGKPVSWLRCHHPPGRPDDSPASPSLVWRASRYWRVGRVRRKFDG